MGLKKGIFIALEGVEGSGKSTVGHFLAKELKKEGYKVYLTREPGGYGSKVAEKIRQLILDPKNKILPETEALLFAASRAQHSREIIKSQLLKRKIVLCDRFVDSSIAYQGYGRGLSAKKILEINRLAVGDCWPNLVLIFDLPPVIGLKRKKRGREKLNRLDKEKLKFHQKVRKAYLLMAQKEPKKYRLIDASKPLEEVKMKALKIIKDYLKNNKYFLKK